MSKVHLVRPGATSPYCGIRPRAGHELRLISDKDKFVRISKNPEAHLAIQRNNPADPDEDDSHAAG
ncbi:hypothetical protein [Pseudomonas syringae]|uniref:hypothetical protein n=1 Tax=Pseudomonas syringae TaxID=317 RepID=UPI0010133637|nr:hypothetical protein [Pseudomonas syringae]